MVLIDLRATHNFLSKKLVEMLEIPIVATVGYEVQLGNGDQVPTSGVYQGSTTPARDQNY